MAVGLLRVDDRHVRVQRRHRDQLLLGERAGDVLHARVPDQVGALVTAHHRKRQMRGTRRPAVGHPRVGMLLDLDGGRPSVLDRIAQAMQRANTRVTGVGEHQLAGRTGADHLVIEHIRRHSDQLELTPALTQDLVPGRERDQMREAFQRDAVPVVHQLGDAVCQ